MPSSFEANPGPGADASRGAPGARLVLASASPRRQELLRDAGYEFVVHPSTVNEEEYPPHLGPSELARFLAMQKANDVALRYPGDVVLGADTVVAFGDTPLGKPEDPEHARQMLSLLSGTTHIVITGVALVRRKPELHVARAVLSAVRMRLLTRDEIEAYVAGGQWQGKAGGYGIQDPDPFVTMMSGSQSNVVGLPMEAVSQMLASAGICPTR